jgi:hypothetical protein
MWLDGRECGSQYSWVETLHDQRNSKLCDSETQENSHMRKVGGRKESIKLVNDTLNKTVGRGRS